MALSGLAGNLIMEGGGGGQNTACHRYARMVVSGVRAWWVGWSCGRGEECEQRGVAVGVAGVAGPGRRERRRRRAALRCAVERQAVR